MLSAARLLQFASTLVLFGSALFFLYGWQRTTSVQATGPFWARRLLAVACALGIASALGWLLAETVALAGIWSAWPDVVTGTRFGEILAVRAGLLVLSLAVTLTVRPGRALWIITSVLGALSVASFVGTGHGSMGEGYAALWHAGADVLHLWLAGVWFGALVPLTILIVQSHRAQCAASTQWIADGLIRFSAIGPAVVSVLALTGLVNAWYLIGPARWRSLFDVPYGWSLLVKLALFACMLALAAVNRLQLTPQLQTALAGSAPTQPVVRKLRVSLLAETLLALLVLAAVSVLGTLEPPVSMSSEVKLRSLEGDRDATVALIGAQASPAHETACRPPSKACRWRDRATSAERVRTWRRCAARGAPKPGAIVSSWTMRDFHPFSPFARSTLTGRAEDARAGLPGRVRRVLPRQSDGADECA